MTEPNFLELISSAAAAAVPVSRTAREHLDTQARAPAASVHSSHFREDECERASIVALVQQYLPSRVATAAVAF